MSYGSRKKKPKYVPSSEDEDSLSEEVESPSPYEEEKHDRSGKVRKKGRYIEESDEEYEEEDYDKDYIESEEGGETETNAADIVAERMEEERKLNEEIGKRGKPMGWTNYIVKAPLLVVTLVYLVAIISLFIIVNYDLYSINDYTDRTYLVYDSEQTEGFDTVKAAQDWVDQSFVELVQPLRTQLVNEWTTTVVFKSKGDDIFTLGNILKMKEIVGHILSMEDIKDYCLASSGTNTSCNPQFSKNLLPYVEGKSKAVVDLTLQGMASNATTWEQARPLVGKDYDPVAHPYTKYTRAVFYFAAPIHKGGVRYQKKADRFSKQTDEFVELGMDIYDYVDDADLGDMDAVAISSEVYKEAFNQASASGAVWALGSFCFVLLYLSIHVRSVFLAAGGMMEALMAMPLALMAYRGIFGITYFSTLHIFTIYIILGIAAANIFLYTDTWEQSAVYPSLKDSYQTRLSWTFKKSTLSMFATASTTAIAFLATAFSKIMPISSFGYYAFMLVTMNFLLIMVQYPALLILYNRYIVKYCNCCSKWCICLKKNKKEEEEISQSDRRSVTKQGLKRKGNKTKGGTSTGKEKEQLEDKYIAGFSQQFGMVENFFANYWDPAVNWMRYIIVLVTLVWLSFATYRLFQMKGLSKPEEFFSDDHPLTDGRYESRNEFFQSDRDLAVKVRFVWGVTDIDREGTTKWDPEDIGKPIWDQTFDPNHKSSQRHLLAICNDMTQLIKDEMRSSTSIICFLKPFFAWATANNHTVPYTPHEDLMPEYDKWMDRIEAYNEKAPQGLKNGKMTAMFEFCFMITEKELLRGALNGMAMALTFALFTLIVCTQNMIIALLSVVIIAFIIISVIAIMELKGWEFGIAESISCVIIIGFSVDYVVHLGNMYVRAPYQDRHNRMKEALKQIAVSIVGGGITTMGAGVFLYFPLALLYRKFATLIVSNISFSLYYSLIFFTAVAHICGPQGSFGDVNKTCKRLCKVEGAKKKEKKKESLTIADPETPGETPTPNHNTAAQTRGSRSMPVTRAVSQRASSRSSPRHSARMSPRHSRSASIDEFRSTKPSSNSNNRHQNKHHSAARARSAGR